MLYLDSSVTQRPTIPVSIGETRLVSLGQLASPQCPHHDAPATGVALYGHGRSEYLALVGSAISLQQYWLYGSSKWRPQ